MLVRRSLFLLVACFALWSVRPVRGEEAPLILAHPLGAALTFTELDGTWRWTGLTVPTAAEPLTIREQDVALSASGIDDVLPPGWTLVDQADGKLVFETAAPTAGLLFRRSYAFGVAANAVRIETWARSLDTEKNLTRAGLLKLQVDGEAFRETGVALSSFPAFGRALFAGIEHVSGTCRATGDTVELFQNPHLKVGEEWRLVATAVVGWPQPDDCTLVVGEARIREAFFQYLDTIRIKPRDLELHTNTWWTLPLPFSETDVLRDIEALQRGFAERTGMFFDSFALDLGWSDPRSIWRVDATRFPRGLRPITDRLAELNCGLGLWVSPGSAYPEGLDNKWLESAGYEVTPFGAATDRVSKVACFALGGRYQTEVRESLLAHARDQSLRHVKLDFMLHACDVPGHGHPVGPDSVHAIDAGLADVLDSLRAVNPGLALEPLCCGYPPSPWWTTKTPYVLGPYGDDVPPGRVPSPDWMESLITARDSAYRNDQERWVMPTQAVETIDIVVQSPGNFENLAVMAIGRGRWFISTYLKPELMTPARWDFLAALVRWARANRQYLGNARMIGGNPDAREAYGYHFHSHAKDILCLRNPWIESRTIQFPMCGSLREPRDLRMIYPRRETLARLEPGAEGPVITLAPYETVMLETVPVDDTLPPVAPAAAPGFALSAGEPAVYNPNTDGWGPSRSLHFSWTGALGFTATQGGELCVLVEGDASVEHANAVVNLAGRTPPVRIARSAGQFFAAGGPAARHWSWFLVPVPAGESSFAIELDVPAETVSVGVYLRGTVATPGSPESPDAAPFPLFRPDERGWSHTLLPLTAYVAEAVPDDPRFIPTDQRDERGPWPDL